jgi:hypothetical protein
VRSQGTKKDPGSRRSPGLPGPQRRPGIVGSAGWNRLPRAVALVL